MLKSAYTCNCHFTRTKMVYCSTNHFIATGPKPWETNLNALNALKKLDARFYMFLLYCPPTSYNA